MIVVRLDNRLHVRKEDLPPGHEEAIKERLTVHNGEKDAAIKRGQWRAEDLPDSFALYEDRGPTLILPRGYAAELRAGLEVSGHEVRWDDQTSAPLLPLRELVSKGPTLRAEQERACKAFLLHKQGVLQAPVAAGKTVLVLEAWRRAGLRGLILVEKASLAKQWRERAREHLGIETGMIGEGEWDERDLTIGMMQTLRSRQPEREWFRSWGFTVTDECHHARADTYQALLRRVVSRYLIGVTATPLEGMWEQPFLTRTIGPIFHITSDEELRRAGQKVAPLIKRVHTGWRWIPANAREENYVDTKIIYRCIIKALQEDRQRARLIVSKIMEQPQECAQIALSTRLGYLDLLEDLLVEAGYEGSIYKMVGSVSSQRREEIAQLAGEGNCVIFATDKVAGEGLDIKRLDRLHLTWPQRQALNLTQQIGRVLRTHPDKSEVVIFDYVDSEGMLTAQARQREMVYRKASYPIEEEAVLQRNVA
jgi:superfamily II DNA or RNA helicase